MAYVDKNMDMAIPVILIILVAVVAGAKIFGFCPPVIGDILCASPGIKTFIITNNNDLAGAKTFASDISSRVTKITPNVDPNVIQHIREGAITSNNYDLVVLYGDDTALTYEARKELGAYVTKGGSLIVVKGAGLKGLNADGSASEYVFGWDVDDLANIIKFSPDCGQATCSSVNQITTTKDEMKGVTLTPVQYDHPVVKRIGLNYPLDISIENYASFTGIVNVQDDANQKIAWFDWTDGQGKPHSVPAIIAYSAGAGGRVVYLAYNPLELNQEDLFRNLIMWATKQV